MEELIKLGKEFNIPLKILKFNPTKSLQRSKKETIWLDKLFQEYKARVQFYSPPGPGIGSSCGQFTKHYYLGSSTKESKIEFEKWKIKYEVFD